MAEYTRKSHYLPRFYLAGFTDTGTSEGKLLVVDNLRGITRPGTPASVGYENDLYRVEHAAIAPDSLESEFAKIEGDTKVVIDGMVQTGRIPPDDNDYSNLLNFVALASARVPAAFDATTKIMTQITDKLVDLTLETRERYEQTVAEAKAAGKKVLPYEKMKALFEERPFKLRVDQNWQLDILVQRMSHTLDELAKRSWSLVIAAPTIGTFACTDQPFVVRWTVPTNGFYSPGLEFVNTEVLFPLHKSVLLVGRYDKPSIVVPANREYLAMANTHLATRADTLFLPSADFIWMQPDRTVGNLDSWRERTKQIVTANRSAPGRSGDLS